MEKIKKIFQKSFNLITLMVMAGAMSMALVGCDDDDSDKKSSDIPPVIEYCGGTSEYSDGDENWALLENGDTLSGNYALSSEEGERCIEIAEDATVNLSGRVLFGTGTILKINPGVTLLGDTDVSISYLIIDQGAKIEAAGTAAKPITFTSEETAGSRSQNDWGGVVINGQAKINAGNGYAYGEGDSGRYGGAYDGDSSGTLNYVRVMFAGRLFSGTNELNGLCLQGVGYNTELDYIQTHNCADDGIEMFGGRCNIKHIVSTGNDDDQIDCTFGWRGKVQFAIAAPLNSCDTAFEHDNNEENFYATPNTDVAYYNVTSINGVNSGSQGARMRRGTHAAFYNAYFAGESDGSQDNKCLYSENANSEVTVDYSIFEQCGTGHSTTDTGVLTAGSNVTVSATPSYIDLAPFASYAALATAGANAFVPGTLNTTAATPPNDGFFDTTAAFIGAVGSTNWLSGWTEFPAN